MDRTSIIVIAACLVLLVLWNFIVAPKLNPPRPMPARGTNAPSAALTYTNQTATTPPALEEAAPSLSRTPISTNAPEQLLEVTNDNAHYTFTSYGGGLKLVELLRYPETLATPRQALLKANNFETLDTYTPAPTLALMDGDAVQGDGIFTLTRTAQRGARRKDPHQWPDHREGLPDQHELPGQRDRPAGEPRVATAGLARAGMDRRHRHADGPARQWHGGRGALV